MSKEKAEYLGNKFERFLHSNKELVKSMAKKKIEQKENITKKEKRDLLKALAENKKVRLEDGTEMGMQEAYAKELVEKTTLGIEAQLVATDFFNMQNLEIGDPLVYTLDEPLSGDARIQQISNHGGVPNSTQVQDGGVVQITPYQITSDEVSMSKFNLKQGDISNEQKMRRRLERNMANEIDIDAWTLLENGLTNDFTSIEGIEIEDRVQEYPEENDIDLNTEGGITLDVMKEIVEYSDMTGIPVRNIYVPANRKSDLYDWLSIPSGYSDGAEIAADEVVPAGIHTEIIRTGTVKNLFGYPVNLIPLNILNGTAGDGEVYIWVSTSKPAGEFRDIPAYSSVYRDEDARRIYLTMNRGVAMFQTPVQRLNYLRIRVE